MSDAPSNAPASDNLTDKPPATAGHPWERRNTLALIATVVLLLLMVIDAYAQYGYKWQAVMDPTTESSKPLYKFEALFGYGFCLVAVWGSLVIGTLIRRSPDYTSETRVVADEQGAH